MAKLVKRRPGVGEVRKVKLHGFHKGSNPFQGTTLGVRKIFSFGTVSKVVEWYTQSKAF